MHKTPQIDSDKTLSELHGRAGGGKSEGIRLPSSLGMSSYSQRSFSHVSFGGTLYSSTGTSWAFEMLPLLILMMFCLNRGVSAPWSSAHCCEVSLLGYLWGRLRAYSQLWMQWQLWSSRQKRGGSQVYGPAHSRVVTRGPWCQVPVDFRNGTWAEAFSPSPSQGPGSALHCISWTTAASYLPRFSGAGGLGFNVSQLFPDHVTSDNSFKTLYVRIPQRSKVFKKKKKKLKNTKK